MKSTLRLSQIQSLKEDKHCPLSGSAFTLINRNTSSQHTGQSYKHWDYHRIKCEVENETSEFKIGIFNRPYLFTYLKTP